MDYIAKFNSKGPIPDFFFDTEFKELCRTETFAKLQESRQRLNTLPSSNREAYQVNITENEIALQKQ